MEFTLETIGDNPYVQDVERGLRIFMNGMIFPENVVSKIVIFKYNGSEQPRIFVELYAGNIEICTWIVNEVEISEDRYTPKGEATKGKLMGYTIRLPYAFG